MPGEMTPAQFGTEVLRRLGIKPNAANVAFMVGWAKAEGGHTNGARYNYYNTTLPMPGAGNTGSQGNIKVYTSWDQGINATVKTLRLPAYKGILAALRGSNPSAMISALVASPWCPNCAGYSGLLTKTVDDAKDDDGGGIMDALGGAASFVIDPLGIGYGDTVLGAAGDTASAVGDVAGGVADAGQAVAHVAGALLNPSTWLRIGKGALGGVLIIAGVGALIFVVADKVSGSSTVQGAAGLATKAAKVVK